MFLDVLEVLYVVVVYICYEYEDKLIMICLGGLKIWFFLLKVMSILWLEFMGVVIGLWLMK